MNVIEIVALFEGVAEKLVLKYNSILNVYTVELEYNVVEKLLETQDFKTALLKYLSVQQEMAFDAILKFN